MNTAGIVNPPALGRPSGFSHGILVPAGARLLFVAGQTAADANGAIAAVDFVSQFEVALAHTLLVVQEAGGTPAAVVRMTVFVTSIEAYRGARAALADIWRTHMGSSYPAMSVIGVAALVPPDACVEIEVTAVVP